MIWWHFLTPALLIALTVRMEAKLIGPYWSWLELVPLYPERRGDSNLRRQALVRRVAVPGIFGFITAMIWPSIFGVLEGGLVAGGAAGLLLWPMVMYGRPYGVRGASSWLLYFSFVGAFIASGALGVSLADLVERQGGIVEYMSNEGAGALIFFVIASFLTGVFQKASTETSKHRESE